MRYNRKLFCKLEAIFSYASPINKTLDGSLMWNLVNTKSLKVGLGLLKITGFLPVISTKGSKKYPGPTIAYNTVFEINVYTANTNPWCKIYH